ncbi:MAG: RNA polymerase sigma factor [Sphingobium sp.]
MADADVETGLAALYRLHRAELLRFLVARTGNAAEAEDVVQEVWLKIATAQAGPVSNGRSYLFRIAQNLVLDRVRERKRRLARERNWSDDEHGPLPPSGEVADSRGDAAQQIEEREEAARLASAIANLPEGAQRVLRLHKIEGLSHGEVAARLGISKSGVEKHMAVAMKHLRRLLED